MAAFKTVIENQIPLLLNRSIMFLSPEMSPLFRTIATSENVVPPGMETSRDWSVRKLVKGSDAGVIEAQGFSSSATNEDFYGPDVSANNRFYLDDGTRTEYPDPDISPSGRTATITIPMASFRGSFKMNINEQRYERLPALIGDILPDRILGVARSIINQRLVHFFADNTDGRVGTISEIVSAGSYDSGSGWTSWTFRMTGNPITRYRPGMILDGHDTSDSGAKINSDTDGPTAFYVFAVDRYTDKVTIVAKGDHADTADPFAVGDIFYTRGGKNNSTSGIRSWLLASGSYYGLSLSDWPEFKSFVKSYSGQPLTEQTLGEMLDRFAIANEDYNHNVDTLFTSRGTFRAYTQQKIGFGMIDRTMSPVNLNNEGTAQGFTFNHNGRKYMLALTDSVQDGDLIGLKVGGGNLKRYVPNATPGAGTLPSSGEAVDRYAPVEFIMPIVQPGLGSIWDATRGSNRRVDGASYAPFDFRMDVVPERPSGILATGFNVTTVRGT